MSASSPLLETQGLTKAFNGVTVLADASVALQPSELHALVGENGAGKSTLAKCLAGVHSPTAGSLTLFGKPVHFSGPREAMAAGVALIPQEPQTFPDLTVAENIFIGRQPGQGGVVDWKQMEARARELLATLGVALDPRAPVRGLSVADRQMIELAAALSLDARVLILDETTASLTPGEVARLAEILSRLKAEGRALAFIGHRMEEIFSLCDRVSVLRDGKVVQANIPIGETSVGEVLKLMVGREIEPNVVHRDHSQDAPLLTVQGLTRRKKFSDISFTVHAGEIVALAGLVGAGRTDVARAIFGLLPLDAGSITLRGQAVRIRSPREALAHGLALVPEDRQQQGALLPWSLWQNVSLARLPQLAKGGFVQPQKEQTLAQQWVEQFDVRYRELDQPIGELSGGNQQKLVLGKWLATEPTVLLLDEPTRGVDVGAKALIHAEIAALAGRGLGVLLISSDLPEVLALADRVLVMREGKLVQELDREQATAAAVIGWATGASA